MKARLFLAGGLFAGAACVALLVAACATDQAEAPPKDDNRTPVPSPVLDADAGDASSDAAPCDPDAGAACPPKLLTCAEAAWCPVPTNLSTLYTLTKVWGSSASDVWAVGSGGMTAHWDGAAWKVIPTSVKNTFRAVWGTGANDVWAVAMTNVILHTKGFANGTAEWTPVTGATSADDATAATAIWGTAAGDLRIGARAWSTFDPKSGDYVRVNQYTKSTTKDGGLAWDPVAATGDVLGLWGSSTTDLWYLADNSAIVDWQKGMTVHGTAQPDAGGLAWTPVDSQSTVVLEGIWGSGPGDVWAVGDKGTIRHYAAGASRWSIEKSDATAWLHAVWGTSASDVWAVGDEGTILHFDGKGWKMSSAAFPTTKRPDLYGVWGSAPNDVWIVGDGIALHYTGNKGGAP